MRLRAKALCPPFPSAIRTIAAQGKSIVEVGAGEGAWTRALNAAGVSCVGYDLMPLGRGVLAGDHLSASAHATRALLAVWPPDGVSIQEWVAAAPYPVVIIVASFARIELGDALSAYVLVVSCFLPEGRKGQSELKIYHRQSAPPPSEANGLATT